MYPVLKYEGLNIRLRRWKSLEVQIFDSIRKKWLLLTPEEWVRQHVVSYLVYKKKYSLSLISLEKELMLNGAKKRYDVVVFNRQMHPVIIIECKAFDVELKDEVLEQAMRYNLVLSVPYVMITNGLQELVLHQGQPVEALPEYNDTI